jgi:hypothetical protein
MKKMNLMLAASLFVVSLNAQLLSVSPPTKLGLSPEATTDLRITKMNRTTKQMNRISIGETITQIAVMKQEKKVYFTVLNANPQIKFSIEDETGSVVIADKIKENKSNVYNLKNLPNGEYTLSLLGSGLMVKRLLTVSYGEISLRDDLGFVTQTNK